MIGHRVKKRNEQLAAEMNAMDPDFDPDAEPQSDPVPIVERQTVTATPVASVADVLPSAPPGMDMVAFAQILANAIRDGQSAALDAAKPKRSSRDDAEFEHKSVFNPEGELNSPRPGLAVPTFWAVLREGDDASLPPIPLYEIEPQQTTKEEQMALNALVPGRGDLEFNDGTRRPYEIYMPVDRITKQPTKLLIAFPRDVYEKNNRSGVPPLKRLARDLAAQSEQVA